MLTRTVDQMIQAARSGRQNIAEGSRAAATSSQTELRLVNVARASCVANQWCCVQQKPAKMQENSFLAVRNIQSVKE